MIEFRPLASSSDGCAYRLGFGPGKGALLLDCGIRFTALEIALDFEVSQLAGCLISHAHSDHCKAVYDLLKRGVKCYATFETWDALWKRDEKFTGPFSHRMKEGQIFHIGDWVVTPFEAKHDLEGTLGFVIDGHGERCLYLTDSAYSKYRFEGLTRIYIECNHSSELMRQNVREGDIHTERYKRTAQNHMSLERLLDMLKANDLSKVKEIHLLHLSDANSDEVAFKEAVQRATGCPVYIAAKREGLT